MKRPRKLRVTADMFRVNRAMFPELERLKSDRRAVVRSGAGRRMLERLQPVLEQLYPIPTPTLSQYRLFARTGNRSRFEAVYFKRRANLVAAVMGHLLEPAPARLAAVHDYLWTICEETTWILPAHERGGMDLFATETAFTLAETLAVLNEELAREVRERVEYEVRRQILDPYLANVGTPRGHRTHPGEENLTELYRHTDRYPGGFKASHNNWNGVCNGSVGAALLYLESNRARLVKGLNEVLKSLDFFVQTAFTEDGSSTEGAGYWQYGLINYVSFAELLRERTGGRVDLLAQPKMRRIAEFPLKVMLSEGRNYSFSDSGPALSLQPGVTARLAARTGAGDLTRMIRGGPGIGARAPMALRDLLWWDGRVRKPPPIRDVLLRDSGVFRLRSGRLVLAGKAGHNGECHNHNDVGSFVIHADGEDLLCDPGRPPYTRDFFSGKRYEIFLQAQSRGHSVPVIGGTLQAPGAEYRGEITRFAPKPGGKTVEMQFAQAYPIKSLKVLKRTLAVTSDARFSLEDRLSFAGRGSPVQEAFVTRFPVTVRGGTARVRGEKSTLTLRIVEPQGVKFNLETHELPAPEGATPSALRRITADLPAAGKILFRVQGELNPQKK